MGVACIRRNRLNANPKDLIDLNSKNGSSCGLLWSMSIQTHTHTSGSHDQYILPGVSCHGNQVTPLSCLCCLPCTEPHFLSYFSCRLPTTTCMLITVSRAVKWNIHWLHSKVRCTEGLNQHFTVYPLACWKRRNVTHKGGDSQVCLYKQYPNIYLKHTHQFNRGVVSRAKCLML